MAQAINTKVGRDILHGRFLACNEADVKRWKVKVTVERDSCRHRSAGQHYSMHELYLSPVIKEVTSNQMTGYGAVKSVSFPSAIGYKEGLCPPPQEKFAGFPLYLKNEIPRLSLTISGIFPWLSITTFKLFCDIFLHATTVTVLF